MWILASLLAQVAYAQPSPAPDRDIVGDRVQRWLSEDAAIGRPVPPAWREVERQIHDGFQPTIDQVTRESAPKILIKQFLYAQPRSAPTARMDSPLASRGEQVAAARRAYEEPRGWRRVEIESEVDAEGKLLALRVVFPSGIRALDRAALAAVREAFERRPPREGHLIAHWAVEAAASVKLPSVGAIVDDVSGRVVGAGIGPPISFDESNGKISIAPPFQRQVHTQVSLIWLRKP